MATHTEAAEALQKRARRQKRTQAATLVLMGATPLVVLGLDPLHTEVRVFRDIQDCQNTLSTAPDYCEALNAEAERRHPSLAPTYDTRSHCEADFAHVVEPTPCLEGWCSADSLSMCETSPNGQYRPVYSGFLVDQSVLDDSRSGLTPAPDSLSHNQLQPVYGISDASLQGEDSSGYSSYSHVPLLWHYVSPGGRYLGDRTLKQPVTVNRFGLASASPKHFSGTAQRGGFGATARQTMQSARS